MQITSVVPFFFMMALFIATGFLCSRFLPPYNSFIPQLLTQRGYYVGLESMRGILALSVVIHHAVVYNFLLFHNTPEISGPHANFYHQLGPAPVTFFFFITSFLFWSKLIGKSKLEFKSFLVARLRRLGPAYLGGALVLFVLVAAFTDFRLAGSPSSLARDVARILLAETPDLNGFTRTPWLWTVTWTLRFEFLFYLLIPFLGWFAQTLKRSLLFIALCNLLYQLSVAVEAQHWRLPAFSLGQGLLRFLSYVFCVGIVAAHLVRIPAVRRFARSLWAAPLSIALLAGTLLFVTPLYGPVESLCLSIPFLLIASGCDFWGALKRPALLFLGQISYSVYLMHCLVFGAILLPLFSVLGSTMATPWVYWAICLVTGTVIIAVSTLWNRVLELPFMGGTKRPRSEAPVVAATPAFLPVRETL